MKGIVAFFQDNAMFYKDITQWLRNKTFGSLFFGLLIIAEAISLLVIAGSDDISQPGVTMFTCFTPSSWSMRLLSHSSVTASPRANS